MRKSLVVVAVAFVVVISGAGAWWALSQPPGSRTPSPKADGPTLQMANGAVNSSVQGEPGGPWGLFSIVGVAAQAPFSANVLGWGLGANETTNPCGSQFDGLTLWNGTMPVFNGSFESGTAPFWQFGFYSSASDTILLATDVLGAVAFFGPIAVTGSCQPWYDLGNPQDWVHNLSKTFVDSPFAVRSAWGAVEQSPFGATAPSVEIITTGPGMFSGFGAVSGGFGLYFDRCGLLDVTGVQPSLVVGENWSGSVSIVTNGSTNCAVLNYPYFAGYGSYQLLFSSINSSTAEGTVRLTIPFQVALQFHNESAPSDFDGWGLANWMTNWTLNSSSGTALPLGEPACRSWVPSIADCIANASGWYVVVLSASGAWINSYGLDAGGTIGWSAPVSALVSHQQLVIVFPSTWIVNGDSIGVTSTVATSSVNGSLAV